MQAHTVESIPRQNASPRSAPDALPEPRWLDVGHSRLAYRRLGTGPDVVFVHGWPVHSLTFRHVVPDIAKHFTCHLVDLPGTGATEWSESSPIDLVGHARTVKAAVDRIGLDRYAIVAHDSGAVIARLLAADDAARVAALVMSGSEIPGHRPKLIEVYAASARLPFGPALIGWLMRRPAVRTSSLGFGGCFADSRYAEGDFRDLFVQPLLDSKRAMAGQSRLLQNLDWSVIDNLATVHRRITVPVCLIWGDHDPFFPIDKAREMAGQFGGPAELHAVAGGKLFIHEDMPGQFVAHALPFLEKHHDAVR